MSAEPKRVTRTEVWVGWENQVINSAYPLRRFLGGSNHSHVFLTEYRPEGVTQAAIKLVPADTVETEAQLVQWGTAATLNHPHLIRIFDVGRCHISGRVYLYVVMEYADQTLAQLLPRRALTPDETREMLIPTLRALNFLHRNALVQGQVKPTNLLVVGDQVKLASDTIRPVGRLSSGILRASLHDPPEIKDGEIGPAGDIWGLGVTLIEALTQHPPSWPDARSETVSLTASIPPLFVDTVRRCLNRAPANRPTAGELECQFNPAVHAHPITVVAAEEPVYEVAAVPTAAPNEDNSAGRKWLGGGVLVLGVAAVFVLGLAVWVCRTIFVGQIEPSNASGASGGAPAVVAQGDGFAPADGYAAATGFAAAEGLATAAEPQDGATSDGRDGTTRADTDGTGAAGGAARTDARGTAAAGGAAQVDAGGAGAAGSAGRVDAGGTAAARAAGRVDTGGAGAAGGTARVGAGGAGAAGSAGRVDTGGAGAAGGTARVGAGGAGAAGSAGRVDPDGAGAAGGAARVDAGGAGAAGSAARVDTGGAGAAGGAARVDAGAAGAAGGTARTDAGGVGVGGAAVSGNGGAAPGASGSKFASLSAEGAPVSTRASHARDGLASARTTTSGAAAAAATAGSPPSTTAASPTGGTRTSALGADPLAQSPDIVGSVLHQQLPDIPRNIRERIRGHVNVTVRVLVDPAGNVVGEFLESAGPSRYFARQAGDVAVDWKFVPTDRRGPRVWMLKFEFTRAGTTVRTVGTQ